MGVVTLRGSKAENCARIAWLVDQDLVELGREARSVG